MYHYQIIGINHRTANAALLSALSLNGHRRAVFLGKITAETGFDGFVLSTCNRTEVYFASGSEVSDLTNFENLSNLSPADEVLTAWADTVGVGSLPTDKFYHYTGSATVEHLYRVTCGLDSKIIGDNEILGQLKEAFLFQKENYGLGGVWERIVGTAIECSRQVRKETDFNQGSISTPYRIAKIIQQKTRSDEPVLLIGAGEMIKLCLKYLRKILPSRKLVITNRSIEKARLLADEFGADYFHFGQLETEMQNFPIIVSAIQVEQPLFHAVFLKKDNPHLLFDLGIPCNFSEEVASAHHYFDIQTIAEFNAATLEQRTNDIRKVEAIVAEQVAQFEDWNRRRLFYKNQKLGNSISLV